MQGRLQQPRRMARQQGSLGVAECEVAGTPGVWRDVTGAKT